MRRPRLGERWAACARAFGALLPPPPLGVIPCRALPRPLCRWCSIDEGARGTLALVRKAAHYGANLDVTFYVRAASGEFTQWGEATRLAFEAVSLNEPASRLGKAACPA